MLTISLIQSDQFSDEVYDKYSRFKHGSKTVAREFGKVLARNVKDKIAQYKDKTIVFYSAPFNNIPTASNALKDYLLSGLAITFLENNIKVKEGKINRLYSYTEDYGLMSKEERKNLIANDKFIFNKSNVGPDDVLIFIDDIKITGQHEVKILEMIKEEEIENEVGLIYLFEYTGNVPSIEHELNHKSVKDLKDLNDIIRNEEFIFNT